MPGVNDRRSVLCSTTLCKVFSVVVVLPIAREPRNKNNGLHFSVLPLPPRRAQTHGNAGLDLTDVCAPPPHQLAAAAPIVLGAVAEGGGGLQKPNTATERQQRRKYRDRSIIHVGGREMQPEHEKAQDGKVKEIRSDNSTAPETNYQYATRRVRERNSKKRDGGPSTIHSLLDGPIFPTSQPPLIRPPRPSSRLSLPPFFVPTSTVVTRNSARWVGSRAGRKEAAKRPTKSIDELSAAGWGREKRNSSLSPPLLDIRAAALFLSLTTLFSVPSVHLDMGSPHAIERGAASFFSTINDVLR